MARKYERKTDRQSWGKQALLKAVAEVVNTKKSVHSVAKAHGIPDSTLRRYLDKSGGVRELYYEDLPLKGGRWRKTFNDHQIKELKSYITDIDKMSYGLTKAQIGRLCFDFAERRGIDHRFNKQKRSAGKDFMAGFMQECPLPQRMSEATSLTLLSSVNAVEKFFDALKELRDKHKFPKTHIYNAGDKEFPLAPMKHPQTMSSLGNRKAVKTKSADHGTNFTCVCAMSAFGKFIPPFFICPQSSNFTDALPPGSEAIESQESSKLTAPSFLKYLEHFVKFTLPSEEHPVLLVMDNHASNLTLETVDFCRESFVFLLGLPPHTNHKLNPLDVAFFDPLNAAYGVGCNVFAIGNPGRAMSMEDVAATFHEAYLQIANPRTAVDGFEATGIEPFDSAILNNRICAPSLTTVLPREPVYKQEILLDPADYTT